VQAIRNFLAAFGAGVAVALYLLATHRRQTTAIDKQVRGAELLGKKAAEAREEARRLNDDAVRQRLRANGWYRED
jgi:hypothetical protein